RRAYSVVSRTIAKGPGGVQALPSTHLHWWMSLRRALAFQNLRVEVAGIAQIDVVGRHGIRLGERLEVRERLFDVREIGAREEGRRRFAGTPLARVQRDQPLDRRGDAAGRDLGRQPREARAAIG